MSLFKSTRADAPSAETRSIFTLPWGGGSSTSSGEEVNTHTALQVGAVWRCVTLVAELISSLPVDVVRADGKVTTPVTKPPVVAVKPSLRVTRREWVYEYVASMMLHGQAIGLILATDRVGTPTVVEWVAPTSVNIVCETSFSQPEYYIDGVKVDRSKIVHVRNFILPGCIEGLSPIEYHAETIGLSIAARKFGARWFGDGGHPSAILSTDVKIDPAQAATIKERFVAALRGRREPAVLGAGFKYTPVQVSPNESQFLETRGATVSEIALIFGVPPEYVGGAQSGSSVTYANREQNWQDFIATCLRHYVIRLEEAWSAMTITGQEVKLNLDALLRGDTKSRYEVHEIGLRNHFVTIDEVRELENKPPLNNGEEFPGSADGKTRELNVAETLQKSYLAVGSVITSDEARELANAAGANLPIPGPGFAPPAAAPTEEGSPE